MGEEALGKRGLPSKARTSGLGSHVMRKYRLAIWDWNGTLQNDATHIYEKCVRRIFRHFTLPCPSFTTYRSEIAHNYIEFYQRHGVPAHVTNEELNSIFRSGTRESSDPPDLFPDARIVLQKTAKIVEKQHLVSGCPADILQEELTHHNLTHFFSRTIGDACNKEQIFQTLMEEHRVSGTETLVIGDFSHDAFAAKAVGAHAILCTQGFHSRPYLESLGNQLDGVTLVDNLQEIPQLLSSLTPVLL